MDSRMIIVLAACMCSIGAMGSGLESWSDVLEPSFIFGALGVIGTTITAKLMSPDSNKRYR